MAHVAGVSLRAIAAKYGLSKSSVARHFEHHVTPARKAELMVGPAKVEQLAGAAADESRSLLEQLQIVRSVLFNQFLNAAEAGDRPQVANVAGRLLESLRELGRLTGELRQISGVNITNNVVNLTASPQFGVLQSGLLRIARAYPEAKGEIVALLRGLDEQPLPANGAHPPAVIEGEVSYAS